MISRFADSITKYKRDATFYAKTSNLHVTEETQCGLKYAVVILLHFSLQTNTYAANECRSVFEYKRILYDCGKL